MSARVLAVTPLPAGSSLDEALAFHTGHPGFAVARRDVERLRARSRGSETETGER